METMDNLLPEDIRLDIFSRLPAESIFECRRVCKTWRALTYHPSFANLHARRQLLNLHNGAATQVGFLTLHYTKLKSFSSTKNKKVKKSLLYYGQYDENDVQEESYKKTLTRVNHIPLRYNCGIVGSCNGLICFSERRLSTYDPTYICNPVTRECVNLPKFKDVKEEYNTWLVCGFGYNVSSNEYKVVRICYHVLGSLNFEDVDGGHVQVYTLGSGTGWRNLGKISHCLVYNCNHGVYVNGALHWVETREGKIVAFDLADEKFRVLSSSPPCLHRQRNMYSYRLMELRGCLCLFHKVNDYTYKDGTMRESKTIWSFKKSKSSFYDGNEEEDECWSWTEDISFGTSLGALALIKNGKFLLCFERSFLCRYEPKTAALEKLWDYGDHNVQYGTITHINSFVSLKSLGEDAKIIKSIEREES